MIYPSAIEIDGKEYEINTGYEYAIASISCLNDTDISEVERAYGVIGILYKEWPDDESEAIRLALLYLRCGKEEVEQSKDADMDYDFDRQYIQASFMSDYKIDMDDFEDMHWWKFSQLIQGLSDNCILNRVRDVRNKDLSEVKDPKSREDLIRAKQSLSLPSRESKEAQGALDDFLAQLNV